MKPTIFVQNNYVERLTAPVARFAHLHGYPLEDRSGTPEFDPDNCGIEWNPVTPVIPYGSVQFVRKVRNSPRLGRYVHHSGDAFSAVRWANIWGAELLNGTGRLVATRDVSDLLTTGLRHVRPNADDKAFNAQVFDSQSWSKVLAGRALPPELPCWVSEPQEIQAEWRCWVVGGQVIEVSRYRQHGVFQPSREPDDAPIWAVARAYAQGELPAVCVVMDIARVAAGYKLLEFNPIHSSGWYAAEVDRVLANWCDWTASQDWTSA